MKTEHLCIITDDRGNEVRLAFHDKALRDQVRHVVNEYCHSVDFVEAQDIDFKSPVPRQRQKPRKESAANV